MLTLLLALAGCGPAPGTFIAGGDYQFFTTAVDDGCQDGALEALFMPEGPATPWAFAFPIYLPAPDELPLTYDVSFRAPFVGMTITAEADGDGIAVRDSVIDEVLLDPDRYGDCAVTFQIDIDLQPVGVDRVSGEARIDLFDARSTDRTCPPLTADPCRVTLTLEAERLGDGPPPAP